MYNNNMYCFSYGWTPHFFHQHTMVAGTTIEPANSTSSTLHDMLEHNINTPYVCDMNIKKKRRRKRRNRYQPMHAIYR